MYKINLYDQHNYLHGKYIVVLYWITKNMPIYYDHMVQNAVYGIEWNCHHRNWYCNSIIRKKITSIIILYT